MSGVLVSRTLSRPACDVVMLALEQQIKARVNDLRDEDPEYPLLEAVHDQIDARVAVLSPTVKRCAVRFSESELAETVVAVKVWLATHRQAIDSAEDRRRYDAGEYALQCLAPEARA